MNLEFLEPLEEGVREAADRLERFAAENEELRARVSELEAELAAARAGSGAAWKKERAEVQRRVARLVETLSALAPVAPAGDPDPVV